MAQQGVQGARVCRKSLLQGLSQKCHCGPGVRLNLILKMRENFWNGDVCVEETWGVEGEIQVLLWVKAPGWESIEMHSEFGLYWASGSIELGAEEEFKRCHTRAASQHAHPWERSSELHVWNQHIPQSHKWIFLGLLPSRLSQTEWLKPNQTKPKLFHHHSGDKKSKIKVSVGWCSSSNSREASSLTSAWFLVAPGISGVSCLVATHSSVSLQLYRTFPMFLSVLSSFYEGTRHWVWSSP